MNIQTEKKRMTIQLPEEIVKQLDMLSQTQGITQGEAIRKAIVTEAFLQKEIQAGGKVLILDPESQTLKEIVFR